MPLQPGSRIGNFIIISQIGKGAFGIVYKARDANLQRLVAIKELIATSPGLDTTSFQSQHKKFEYEVETLARFTHPNVVAAYVTVRADQADYLVMEYVGGDSLKKIIGPGRPLPIDRAVAITIDICHAIAEMSRHGIVHRDIKPGNILLTPTGQAKLTDFGVAQVGNASKRFKPSGRNHPGTPRYMSPEQESSTNYLDQRSDLYSLGLVLYEMLTGQNYKSIRKAARQVNPSVPRALEAALNKVLQKEPDQRYQTAHEFEQALRRAVPPSVASVKTNVDPLLQRPGSLTVEELLNALEANSPLKGLRRLVSSPENKQRAEKRRAIAEGLGMTGDTRAVGPLIEQLRDPEPEPRQAAALALGNIGGVDAVETLQSISQNDPTQMVRDAANRALKMLSESKSLDAQVLPFSDPHGVTQGEPITQDDGFAALDPDVPAPHISDEDQAYSDVDEEDRTEWPEERESLAEEIPNAAGDPPSEVRLSALFNVASARDLDLRKIWAEHADPRRQLVAAIGRASGDRLLELDLHITKHGTHGLIAGTTGAGKTVLLSTVIASLAVSNSPRLVNFVIIDMNGDNDLELLSHLPHTVGFASVLNKSMEPIRIRSYIGRAIIALENEIKRRMQILSDAGQNDIFEYNRRHPDAPLPHLMVIIDEFAVLKRQFSELMDRLVDVSALGRAPGVHLILCTQSPSGAVSRKIWDNTQFRICLRVANVDESLSVLHRQDAAFLPIKPQGRAFLQAGGGEVEIFEPFQVAWPGGRVDTFSESGISIDEQGFNRTGFLTELQYFVDLATRMAIEDGLQLPLRGPWLPPLAESIALDSLLAQYSTYRKWTGTGWTEAATEQRLRVPLGMVDSPATQHQFPLIIDLGREHVHVWLGGVMGAGKSTCLRSLIVALAQTHTPAEVHLYLLSFGKQALKPMIRFPHVGAVIQISEVERLQRLFIWLDQEVTRRRNLFVEGGVDSIEGYRRITGQSLPCLIVMIEGFGDLVKEAARVNELQDVLDQIARLLYSGAECDLHFVFSTTTAYLYRDMAASVNGRLALRQQTRSDYSELLAIRTGGVELDDIEGRGLWRMGNDAFECQIAAPTSDVDDVQHSELIAAMAKEMNHVWADANGSRPRPIEVLTAHLTLGQLLPVPKSEDRAQIPAQEALSTVIGLDDDLQLVSLDLIMHGPSLLLIGAPKCGKTALLETLAVSLATNYSPDAVQLYGLDLRRDRLTRTLNGLANMVGVADSPNLAIALLDQVLAVIAVRNQQRTDPAYKAGTVFWPQLILLADDVSRQLSDVSKENETIFDRLDQCYKQGRSVGFHLIIAGDGSNLSSMSQPFMQQLKSGQRGFVFAGAVDNASMLGVRALRVSPKNILAGRAFLVQPNGTRLMQIAQFDAQNADAEKIVTWLNHCKQSRSEGNAKQSSLWYLGLSVTDTLVEVGQVVSATINLSVQRQNQHQVTVHLEEATVIARVSSSGLSLYGERLISITIPQPSQSEAQVRIEFVGLRSGQHSIMVAILDLEGKELATIQLPIVVRQNQRQEMPELPSPLSTRSSRLPDLTTRVYVAPQDEDSDMLRFSYIAYSPHSRLRLPGVRLGTVNISRAQLNWLQSELNAVVASAHCATPTNARIRFSIIGKWLYHNLFPAELCALYQETKEQIRSWQFLCDVEPWIPWELVKPFANSREEDFLGAQFAIIRGIEGLGTPIQDEFPVGSISLTLDSRLTQRHQAQEWLELFSMKVIPERQSPLLSEHAGGYTTAVQYASPIWGLHFEGIPDTLARGIESLVVLDAEQALSQESVEQATLDFWGKRPLVTFGMVQLEDGRSALSEMETKWVPTFVKAGVGAFVGLLWAANPRVDRLFWSAFYRAIWERKSLGEAVFAARQFVRAAIPDSMDWLAYFAVGNPMAQGYAPEAGEGYAVLECTSHNLEQPLQVGECYDFLAQLAYTPPVSYHGRRYKTAPELILNPRLSIFAPEFDVEPASDMTLVRQAHYFRQNFKIRPRSPGKRDVFSKFFDGEELLQTLDFTVEVKGVNS